VIFFYSAIPVLLVLITLFAILLLEVKEARRISKKTGCCQCGSKAMHVSRPTGLLDPLLTHWNCVPYRCEVCYRRQYRIAHPSDDKLNRQP